MTLTMLHDYRAEIVFTFRSQLSSNRKRFLRLINPKRN